MDPAIPNYTRSHNRKTPGQAAILVHNSRQAVQHRWDGACDETREVVIARITPPGGKPTLIASVYYKPTSGAIPYTLYDWIPHLLSLNFSGPIIIGGDLNAGNTLWGYSSLNRGGRLLEQTLEFRPLQLRNEHGDPTRIGLYHSQDYTTPDLIITTPGVVQTWCTLDSTWGSNHYPIVLQINEKKGRTSTTYYRVNWSYFCEKFLTGPHSTMDEFATETITSTAEVDHLHSHMFQLLRKAERLTRRYRTQGKRHHDLMKLKHRYRVIR